jgi:predicted nuclease with TOPRIM domain
VAQASVQLRELQEAVEDSKAALKVRNERLSDRSELQALQRQLQRVESESRGFAEQLVVLHDLHWRHF